MVFNEVIASYNMIYDFMQYRSSEVVEVNELEPKEREVIEGSPNIIYTYHE